MGEITLYRRAVKQIIIPGSGFRRHFLGKVWKDDSRKRLQVFPGLATTPEKPRPQILWDLGRAQSGGKNIFLRK